MVGCREREEGAVMPLHPNSSQANAPSFWFSFALLALLILLSSCTGGQETPVQMVNEGIAAVTVLDNGRYTLVVETSVVTAEERRTLYRFSEEGRFQKGEKDRLDWYKNQTREDFSNGSKEEGTYAYIQGEYLDPDRKTGERAGPVQVVTANPKPGGGEALALQWSDLRIAREEIGAVDVQQVDGGASYTFTYSEEYLTGRREGDIALAEQSLADGAYDLGGLPPEKLQAFREALVASARAKTYLSQHLTVRLDCGAFSPRPSGNRPPLRKRPPERLPGSR